MTKRILTIAAGIVALFGTLPWVSGHDNTNRDVFEHLLQTSDLVLETHIDPPTRQQLILAATKGLLTNTGQPLPTGLARRVSDASTRDELTAILRETWEQARKGHKSDGELQEAAVESLLTAAGCRLMSSAAIRVDEQIRANRYVGIGIRLGMADDAGKRLPEIMAIVPGGPADQAGVRAGDRILEIDGAGMSEKTLNEVIELIRGEEGTPIELVVRQSDSTETRTLQVIRGTVPFQSVLGYLRGDDGTWRHRIDPDAPIGYIEIVTLHAGTLHELRRIAETLQGEGVRALVIDLRSCQVHRAHEAALLADALLDGGTIGGVRKADGSVQEFRADPDALFRDWPMAVLINRFTCGGPELLAAVLQDNGRALLVGAPTAGAGGVIEPVQLPGQLGAALIPTGVMHRADGRPLSAPEESAAWMARAERGDRREVNWSAQHAVEPDHRVAMTSVQYALWVEWETDGRPQKDSGGNAAQPEDPQLDKALELLRSALKDQPGGPPKN